MADVLALSIELPDGKYASVNNRNRGLRDPRKSEIYKAVFDLVKRAAEDAIFRTGWITAECECSATIIRVLNRRARVDASNLSKVEWDALTAAGVWSDDRLANPSQMLVRYDDAGPHRVNIIVTKLYEPAHVRIVDRPKRDTRTKSVESADNRIRIAESKNSKAQRYTGGPIPEGMAIVDGFIVPASEALALISESKRRS